MAWNQGRRRGGGGQQSPIAPVPCPQCGGPMYDNSETKTNPKAPDYVCKNRDCIDDSGYRTGIWATDTQRNAAQAVAPAPQAATAPAQQQQPKKLLVIDKAMEQALKAAKKLLTDELGTVTVQGDTYLTLTVNLATTMYISRTRDKVGVFKAEKEALVGAQQRAKEAAEAERKRKEEEERARATAAPQGIPDHGYYPDSPDDDDLPF